MADVNEFPPEGSANPLAYLNDYDTSGAQEKTAKKLPPKGRYALKSAPTVVVEERDNGLVAAQIDPTIVGGEFDGHQFKYVRVDTRQYKGRRASSFGDWLFASGFAGRFGGDAKQITEQLRAAATAMAGRPFQADLDYSLYCKGCKTRLAKTYSELPSDANGNTVGWAKCPTCKEVDTEGNERPKTVWAEPRFFFIIPKKA
jgi:hypothetical protein